MTTGAFEKKQSSEEMNASRALVVCNGEKPSSTLLRSILLKQAENVLLIAADGGANIAKELDIRPSIVIGDMDSWHKESLDGLEVVHDPDQETNDLEKALALAHKRGIREVTILAGLGKRLDHSLKNLSVLRRFHDSFDSLVLLDDHCHVELLRSPSRRSLPIGTPVSLFPLSGVVSRVFTKGLKYEWSGEDLINGVRDGTSNEMVHSELFIDYEAGDLLLILPFFGEEMGVDSGVRGEQ